MSPWGSVFWVWYSRAQKEWRWEGGGTEEASLGVWLRPLWRKHRVTVQTFLHCLSFAALIPTAWPSPHRSTTMWRSILFPPTVLAAVIWHIFSNSEEVLRFWIKGPYSRAPEWVTSKELGACGEKLRQTRILSNLSLGIHAPFYTITSFQRSLCCYPSWVLLGSLSLAISYVSRKMGIIATLRNS